jgi:SAM-dependent methyltransferase
MTSEGQRAFYNRVYTQVNYFSYCNRLYRPYVRSVIALATLEKGAQILDAGCGQGLFCHLFAKEGMVVFGTDVSRVGIERAQVICSHDRVKLFVADINSLPLSRRFDCVFVRSCSLFNSADIGQIRQTLESLRRVVKPGGVLVFAYNSNLSGRTNGWRHHCLQDIRAWLELESWSVDLYFANRWAIGLFGTRAFSAVLTRLNAFISRSTGLGGEIVAVCRQGAAS